MKNKKKYTQEEALEILLTTIRLEKVTDIVPLIKEHVKKKQIQIWGK